MVRTTLHFFPTFALGGSQRRFAQIAKAAGDWRHVIVPLDNDRGADGALGEVARTYRTVSLSPSSSLSLDNLRRLRAVLAQEAPHLVCTYNWGSIEAVIANRLGPRVPHLHFEDGFGPEEAGGVLPRRRWVRRAVLGLGGPHVAVPSSFLAAAARDDWRIPEARLHKIDNGVDLARFVPAQDHPPVIAYLGALRLEKNVARLIRAANETGTSLDVWGDGPERGALQALAGPTVRLRGATDAPEAALAGAGILALSSDTEQMPLTVLEAMASGLPVLATDVGDIAAMVSPENRAFVTPLGDDAAYASAMARLRDDEGLRRTIGHANRARAEARYGLGRMTDAYAALMDRLVASRADAR